MGLDLRYIPATYFQLNFIDKTTAMPLAGGKVYFWKDQARTVPKDIFQLSGSPPNYTYTALPNPCTLNANGTFQDNSGNDIVPYFLPYDSSGNTELYFIEVYSSGAVFQFSRDGVPNVGGTAEPQSADINNYIPNGQFIAHNKVDMTGLSSMNIAPGGWSYYKSSGTATDLITFPRFGSPITNPTSSPRYACRIQCTVPHSGDTFKWFYVAFRDVNRFSSDVQQYTLSFSVQSNSGASITIPIKVRKYFGSGGSTDVITQIANVTIGSSYQTYNVVFVFGLNTGKTIGPNEDDYVEIFFDLPPTTPFDISWTDMILTDGNVNITYFPQTTQGDFMTRGVAGWLPKPRENNLDLYLPIRIGLWGLEYDDTQVGKVMYSVYSGVGVGELFCDGSQHDIDGYSSDHIPLSRLASKLYNYTLNLPSFGTGLNYVTAHITSGISSNITLSQNTAGDPTDLSLGSPSPGFTVNAIANGATTFDFKSGYGSAHLIVFCQTVGSALSPATAGTSGFTVTQIQPGSAEIGEVNDISISSVAALAGTYFLISNTTIDYYVWFRVNGAGADPAVAGRTGIRIDLLSTHDVADACRIISQVLSGYYVLNMAVLAGSGMTAGSYFTFYTPAGTKYYIWYTVDGIGTDPAVSGALKGKCVPILSTDTAADVAFATVYGINTSYFRLPYLYGQFIRIWSNTQGYDPDRNIRISDPTFGGPSGDNVGSFQWWQNLIHLHPATSTPTYNNITGYFSGGVVAPNETGGGDQKLAINLSIATSIGNTGGNQSNPVNTYLNAIIKY